MGVLHNPQVQGCAITAQGLTVSWSLGGEKNCIVYSLFYIFIIILSGFDNITATAPTQIPKTGIAAEPENQPMPVPVTPVQKKQYIKNSDCKGEDEAGLSQEQGEEPEVTTQSLPLGELRDT